MTDFWIEPSTVITQLSVSSHKYVLSQKAGLAIISFINNYYIEYYILFIIIQELVE